MKKLIDSYIEWLKEGISVRELKDGWHEIVTPFLNHKNDMIELYIKQDNDQILISDGGNTLSELKLSGLDLNKSPKRLEELNTILRSFGLQRNDTKEIFVRTNKLQFPEVKHRFIQAILSIDDMFMLSSPKVENFFIEDVTTFLELNEVIFVKDTSFVGKSGFSHKFDFTLPKIKTKKEIVIKAINSPRKDKIGSVLWMFQDTQLLRPNTDGLVIINDEHELTNEVHQAFGEYQLPYIAWSKRNESLKLLRA